ncbi:MAG: OmpA family protein [candidate division WOR-3 bacterium]
MKTATRLMTAVLGIVLVTMFVGCPKKCVKPVAEEPVVVPPDTTPVEVKKPVELNLATIHFDFDKYDIRPGDATILQNNADQIRRATEGGRSLAITIEGHCDPIGTSEYNMALGMRRAEAAKAYLVRLGLPTSMFSTISYGEERLVTQDPAQYELNRRAEFKTQ